MQPVLYDDANLQVCIQLKLQGDGINLRLVTIQCHFCIGLVELAEAQPEAQTH